MSIIYINDENKYLNKDKKALIKKAACEAVVFCRPEIKNAEISIKITDNQQIREINSQYRNIDKPTDVLSFPSADEQGVFPRDPDSGRYILGDIVISCEKAVSQSEEYGHPIERELAFLSVHGCLHLLGYDHEKSKKDEEDMFKIQESVIKKAIL